MVGVQGGHSEAVGLDHVLDLDDLRAVEVDHADMVKTDAIFEMAQHEVSGDGSAV